MATVDFRNLKPFRDYQRSLMLARRLTLVRVMVIALFVLQVGVFGYLQLAHGARFRTMAEDNRLHRKIERPLRGILLDESGRVLVTNRPSFSVYLDRERTERPEQDVQELARLLASDPEPLLARLRRARNQPRFMPVLLMPDVELDIASRVEAHRPELHAIDVAMEARRHYPLGPCAAHAIGYLSEATDEELDSTRELYMGDRVGRTGAERVFDDLLRGQAGILLEEVNARGRSLGVAATLRPTRLGRSVRMTIDGSMQRDLEEAFEGRGGAAVFLDPATGGVRALYSAPAFDPNVFSGHLKASTWNELVNDPEKPLQNRALLSAYSPGSTFKVVMACAAQEEGVVDDATRISCGGSKAFYGRTFMCWRKGGHGSMDVREAVTQSCNVFFYTVGQRLGIEAIAKWGTRFGLGQVTALPLKQTPGIMPSDAWKRKVRGEKWYPGETISVAIGQGLVQATPIQMAVVAAAIANGGYRVHPHLGERPGEVPSPELIGLSPHTVQNVREAMINVVMSDRGTARRARVPGITVAGKTGTAQTIGREAGKDKEDNAWFIGFAPAENPKLAWAIIVEAGGHGGEAAAPIAGLALQRYFERHPLPGYGAGARIAAVRPGGPDAVAHR
ncbi:MAG: penicillin-binding protein 2 [Acidobacteria bacterium]|nr:penicillin-binding protein 2 [Acidobacteriota bacterium]